LGHLGSRASWRSGRRSWRRSQCYEALQLEVCPTWSIFEVLLPFKLLVT